MFQWILTSGFIQYTWDVPLYILRGHRVLFQKIKLILALKIDFVVANSADPDEMSHYGAFHLCLHCLSKYPFRGFWFTMKKHLGRILIMKTI